MQNADVVEQLHAFKDGIRDKFQSRRIHTFPASSLSIQSSDQVPKITIGGLPVGPEAAKEVANRLRVKPKFFQLDKKMSVDDFNEVNEKLKGVDGDHPFFAMVDESDSHPIITELYSIPPARQSIEFTKYFDFLTDELSASKNAYEMAGMKYGSGKVFLDFVNRDHVLEVLPDDPWKVGNSVEFSAAMFSMNPYFLRKVCTNGMVTRQGFSAKIFNKKYNEEKIKQIIADNFEDGMADLQDKVQRRVSTYNKHNISIMELEVAERFFREHVELDEEKADAMLHRYFPTDQIYKAYGQDFREKSERWKSTADAGVNAYDHFNNLTWIASHPKENGLDRDMAQKLMIGAGAFLMKESLDMTQIAPRVRFDNM